jgi:hypothetical protein
LLNHINLNFFVKMIGIESFRNPKNWTWNWIKGSIQKPKKKERMEPLWHPITRHMWSYLVHMWGGSKYLSSFQFEGMKFKLVCWLHWGVFMWQEPWLQNKTKQNNNKKKEKYIQLPFISPLEGFFLTNANKMLMV